MTSAVSAYQICRSGQRCCRICSTVSSGVCPELSIQSPMLPLLFAAHGQGMLPRCDLADLFAGLYLVAELPHRHAGQEPPVRMGNRITPPVVDASDLP